MDGPLGVDRHPPILLVSTGWPGVHGYARALRRVSFRRLEVDGGRARLGMGTAADSPDFSDGNPALLVRSTVGNTR